MNAAILAREKQAAQRKRAGLIQFIRPALAYGPAAILRNLGS